MLILNDLGSYICLSGKAFSMSFKKQVSLYLLSVLFLSVLSVLAVQNCHLRVTAGQH